MPTASRPIKVAIVEDHQKIREGLTALIDGTEGFRAAGSFRSMEEALAGIAQDLPDVALLDIGLPGRVGFMLSRSAFSEFKKRIDHTEYGGAPLLGLKGVCIITHGSSNANAIKNAVRVAAEFAERHINESIERGLAELRPAPAEVEVAPAH